MTTGMLNIFSYLDAAFSIIASRYLLVCVHPELIFIYNQNSNSFPISGELGIILLFQIPEPTEVFAFYPLPHPQDKCFSNHLSRFLAPTKGSLSNASLC